MYLWTVFVMNIEIEIFNTLTVLKHFTKMQYWAPIKKLKSYLGKHGLTIDVITNLKKKNEDVVNYIDWSDKRYKQCYQTDF